LAVDIYRATYGYVETSEDTTSLSASALLNLTSSRRQDYESAWYPVSEALPGLLDRDLEAGVAANNMKIMVRDFRATRRMVSFYTPNDPTFDETLVLHEIRAKRRRT
jgi:hypothetical protein